MGNPVSGHSESERTRLAYALFAVGALVIAYACVIWQEAILTTPHSALLIAGCALAIAGLVVDTQSRARTEPDVQTFIGSCLAEALFGAALAFAAVSVVFGQTKSSDRLGYFLTALVIVPVSVVLSRRFSAPADGDERGRSRPVILLAFTVLAIGATRISGSGHVSLKLLLLLLIARALTALVSRTRVAGAGSRLGPPPFTVVPLLLAIVALAFAPTDQLSFGHLVAAAAAGTVVAVGWVALRSRVLTRGARYAIDALGGVISILVVFQLALPNGATSLNGNYFLGPADDVLHGHPMLIDTFSQYGVGMFDALAGFFSIFTLGYGVLQLLISTLTALQWATIYAVVRIGTKSQLMAILAVAIGIPFYVFGSVGVFTDYPSTGVLRFGLPWLVILLSVGSARLGEDRYRRHFDATVLVVVALAAQWSGEAGIYCLGTACAIAFLNAASLTASPMQRTRAAVLSLLRLFGAYLLGVLLFTIITRLAAGRWPEWGPYIDFIRLYTTEGLGAEDIASWSPGLAMGGVYAASAAVIIGVLLVEPDAVRERLASFRALAGLTALGPLVFTYFLGRSDPNNLIWISPPFVALVFVWLGIASASFAARLPAAVAIASVTFVGGFLIAAIRPAIDLGFHNTAFSALLEHPGKIRIELGTLKRNPVVSPPAVAVEDFVDAVHVGHRPLTILVYPAFQSEALFRLGQANAVGTSNPCQEELSQDGGAHALSSVRSLRPGGVLVTIDGSTYGPLSPLQHYTLELLEARFTVHEIAVASAGLVAYSLGSVKPTWNGGRSVPQPGRQLGAPGCG